MINFDNRGLGAVDLDDSDVETRDVTCPVTGEDGTADVVTWTTRGSYGSTVSRAWTCPTCGAEHETEDDGYDG